MAKNWTVVSQNQTSEPKIRGYLPVNPEKFAWHCKCLLSSMYNKTSFLITATIGMFFVGLMAKLLASLEKHAPMGYQDESGFHLGVRNS
jgi:hypothetical protein